MAGRIPKQFIDDVVLRTDIVSLIDERVPLKKKGREYMACCPFHQEKTPSFTVSSDKQFYHCFGCGAHGTALGFLMDYERLEFREAVEELARRAGLDVPSEAYDGAPREDYSGLYALLEQAADLFRHHLREHPNAGQAVGYLKGRGLSGEVAARFGMGYAPAGWDNLLKAMGGEAAVNKELARVGLLIERDDGGYYDRFRERVMFPIRDRRGRTIGFGGRVLSENAGQDKASPKYLNSPETPVFHKGRELYGLHEIRQTRGNPERIVVVEGYMDVVALSQFGINNAVATLGTAATDDHLEALFRVVGTVVFSFDGDTAGRRAAWRALETSLPHLRDGRQVSFVFLPEGEDPDSLVREQGAEGFNRALDAAMPLSQFIFSHLREQVDGDSPEGRAKLVKLAKPLLARLPGGAFRQLMQQRLAEITRMESGSLATLLGSPVPAAPVQATQTRRRRAESGRAPSLVRRTITLLLHHPEVGEAVAEPGRLSGIHLPGVDLLRDMLEVVQTRPGMNMAALLEHYRDTPHSPHLEALASAPDSMSGAAGRVEFQDAITSLLSKMRDQRLEELQARSRGQALSAVEKDELRQLLLSPRGSD